MRKYKILIKNNNTEEKKCFYEEYLTFAEAFRSAHRKCTGGMVRSWEVHSIERVAL